jgi:RNA polymerase sigma factor (sigma-70 family)
LQDVRSALGLSAVTVDWERLYVEHAEHLLRYLAKLTGEREAASELMQETFVRGLRSGAPIAGPERAWLFRVATNLARDRRRRDRLFSFIPFTGQEPARALAFDPVADQVKSALRSIPFDQAATLLLHYQGGFTRAEIAAMHGVSEETVKSRIARGRKAFVASYRRLERGVGA